MERLLCALERRTERYLTKRKQVKEYNRNKKKTLLGEIWSWIDALIFAVFWVIIINQYLFQFFLIPSPSMVSTLNVGDRVAVIKNAYGTELYPAGPKIASSNRRVERDDIITFYNPEYDSKGPAFDILSQVVFMGTLSLVNIDKNPDGSVAERLYVKRAVGFPGDTIRFENGDVLIKVNGENEFVAEDEFQRLFQQTPARDVVVVIAEARDAELIGQRVLAHQKAFIQQIVEADGRMRELRLFMPGKERPGGAHVARGGVEG